MKDYVKPIKRILIANRGEIAIRIMRAASELGITTVALYTFEDRYSLHRYKADEAYQIGANDEALKPYLDIETIIKLAKSKKIDAIHPGYGFLSENVTFVRETLAAGIIFIGPRPDAMDALGDKVAAKNMAMRADVPLIPDFREHIPNIEFALSKAKEIGFPMMVKAVAGGGGRGMRVVRTEEDFTKAYTEAKNEAKTAFGNDVVFLEKFVVEPKHLEVQLLGDSHGNLVHLYERDCSVQRRFQKVVEVAPSIGLKKETRQKLYEYALKMGKAVNYQNAGTVEFLVDKDENVFFIEVNPRIQVEHTITEEITGIDIVRSQILIAMGYKLSDPCIFIHDQEDVPKKGYAIQCRITTEDPANGFKPDFGTLIAYRNAAGFGIRLDEGSAYPGMKISPYFDSMIVKVTARGRTLKGAAERLSRALVEFRVRGVKTNIPFLSNVIKHPQFQLGKATVSFIETHPDLLQFRKPLDRSTRAMRLIADVIVNGNPTVGKIEKKDFPLPKIPIVEEFSDYPDGNKQRLESLGPDKFAQWVKEQKSILYTDTTFRDGHQSLLATRVRTADMMAVAEGYAKSFPQLFSMEVWGGATFDVAMRFLYESPWKRLEQFREAMPNMLLQMLLRGSNAVGYTAYPNNLVESFIEESAKKGIDVFRIFDSLNWIESMKLSIRTVRERTNSIAEAAICYTGEMLDPNQKKYTLQYYLDMARQLEDEGAHIIAIKDMAGLLKPYTAEVLIREMKKAVNLPIHLHTHDTSSIQSSTYLKATDSGVDIIDCALGGMSGLTSQPNFNSVVAMFKGHERECEIDLPRLNQYSNYWEDVRNIYAPFESGLKSGSAEVYEHQMPGGQYSNLKSQSIALGLGDKFDILKHNYSVVNELLGDIVKVTPSSKVVGDMALFMTSNSLDADDIFKKGDSLSFPESVKGFFKGDLGQPPGGFPKELQKIILKDIKPYTDLPNAHMESINLEEDFKEFQKQFPNSSGYEDYLSFKLYDKVYEAFHENRKKFGDVSIIPSHAFWYGLHQDEEILMQIDEGKTILVRYLYCSAPDEEGMRTVSFDLNGQTRKIKVRDRATKVTKAINQKVSKASDIGAPLQGRISRILVKKGDEVQKNTPLFVIEAMKMESIVASPFAGIVGSVQLEEGAVVEQDDRVVEIDKV